MQWADRTPGTWMLGQFVNPGSNGAYEYIGEFPSYRAAVEAARRIAKFSTLKGEFNASYCRSNDRKGAEVDGFSRYVSLEEPEHDPHIEVQLEDGRVFWLEDLEAEMRAMDMRIQQLVEEKS